MKILAKIKTFNFNESKKEFVILYKRLHQNVSMPINKDLNTKETLMTASSSSKIAHYISGLIINSH